MAEGVDLLLRLVLALLTTFNCLQDTYGQYAELRHTAEEMTEEPSTLSADIKAERDYMDTVCRSFASRLERRRTLLITSVRFHRLAENVRIKLSFLIFTLCNILY